MAARGFPLTYKSNTYTGRIIPPRGLIHNVRLQNNALEPTYPVLAWNHEMPDAGQPTADRIVRIYRNGDLEQTVHGYDRTVIGAMRSGDIIEFGLEAVTPREEALVDSTNAFAIYPRGDRAEISWTECTASDFGAYRIYWDEGDGAVPDTVLARIEGPENTRTVTGQLTNGSSYKFALALEDALGNVGAIGTVYSLTADAPPLALTGATINYSAVTRKATITARQPAGQHSDVSGAALYDNCVPGLGLSEYPNVDYGWRRAFAYTTTGTVSFVTDELSTGQWRFAVRAADRFGGQSGYSVLTLNVKANMTAGSIVPLAPENLSAYATGGGGIVLIWDHEGASATSYKAYTGGTIKATVTTNLTTTPHQTTVASLDDGVGYTFHVLAYNGGIGSPSSNAATATADSAAPVGSRALTLELF